MIDNFRNFEATDPFGQVWQVSFLWLQNAISIRHTDAVDLKFELRSGETALAKFVALTHPELLALSRKSGRPVTDPWCARLAALHLRRAIETGKDIEKTPLTPRPEELEEYEVALQEAAPAR